MLASTVQFSTNTKPTPTYQPRPTPHDAVSRPVQIPPSQPKRWLPQDPTGCLPTPPPTAQPALSTPTPQEGQPYSHEPPLSVRDFTSVSAIEHPATPSALRGPLTVLRRQVLLRKEVIQPHLPVRLPCYDFVPIASPTFDGSLPEGLGHRLRVLPTFVT